jgi:N-acyl-D-amino-acid deacylase
VCPGFIDTHSHSDVKVLADPLLPMKVRQGITLEVFGQDGISVAPVRPEERAAWKQKLAGLLGDFGVEWDWASVREYLARIARAEPAPDIAYLVPHGAIRQCVLGGGDRRADAAALAAMQGLLRESLAEGACGLSTGLIYPPCCYADTEELIALGRVLAEVSRPLVVHMRSESDRILEALDEMIRVARESGCPVHVSHLKVAGRENWPRAGEVARRLEEGRRAGLRLTADSVSLRRGQHAAGSDPAALGPRRRARRPRSRAARPRSAPAHEVDDGRPRPAGLGQLLEVERAGRHPDRGHRFRPPPGLAGQDAGRRGPPPRTGSVRGRLRPAARGAHGRGHGLVLPGRGVVEQFLRLPFVNVCTDGLLGGRPHPRAYGTYPRILGRYVRERSTLSLEKRCAR